MKTKIGNYYVKIWLSGNETHAWANRAGSHWPCSQLSGKRLFAEFDRNGLCDLAIDGKMDDCCDSNELNAIVCDHLKNSRKVKALKRSLDVRANDLYFVVVGQFA